MTTLLDVADSNSQSAAVSRGRRHEAGARPCDGGSEETYRHRARTTQNGKLYKFEIIYFHAM